MAQEDRFAELRKKLKEVKEIVRGLREEESSSPSRAVLQPPAGVRSRRTTTEREEPRTTEESALSSRIDEALAKYFQEKAEKMEARRKRTEVIPSVPKERLIVPQGASSIPQGASSNPQREVKPVTPFFRVAAMTEEEARKLVPPQGYFGAPREGGRRHTGVDIYLEEGTPVASPVDGTVHHFGEDKVLGKFVRVRAGDHFVTLGHLKDIEPGLKPGTPVKKDESIVGYVGNTGNAAGMKAHIHFIVRKANRTGEPGEFLNPAVLFPQFRFAIWEGKGLGAK